MLIIDMQPYFLYPTRRKDGELERQIGAIRTTLQSLSCFSLFAEYAGYEKTVYSLRKGFCLPRLIKDGNNAFDTSITIIHRGRIRGGIYLNELLHKCRVTSLVLAGVNATSCVLDTAMSAKFHGFEVVTARDLIGDNYQKKPIAIKPNDLSWYEKNATFFEDHQGLVQHLNTTTTQIYITRQQGFGANAQQALQ